MRTFAVFTSMGAASYARLAGSCALSLTHVLLKYLDTSAIQQIDADGTYLFVCCVVLGKAQATATA